MYLCDLLNTLAFYSLVISDALMLNWRSDLGDICGYLDHAVISRPNESCFSLSRPKHKGCV